MSHNASGALCPFITSHTAALSEAGSNKQLVITGFGLSLGASVEIPSALGVETARSYSKTSATSGTLTITLTVESFTEGTSTNRTISISQGGVPAQGPDVTNGAITVAHGWSPEVLVKSASDGWFNPSGMAKNSAATGYEPADGDAVVEWRVNGTTSGLSKMYNSIAAGQPSYIAAHTSWDSSTNHPGIGRGVGGGSSAYAYQAWLENTNDGTWDRADGDNYTIAIAHTTLNVTDFKGNTNSGRCFVRWTNGTGGGNADYTDYIWDSKNNASDITTRARGNSSSYDQDYTRTGGASTRLIALRRDGSTASVFYNSGTAVQTYTPSGTATDTAHFGKVILDAAVIAEVLFLKYAASDSEMASLMSYWNDKYGS